MIRPPRVARSPQLLESYEEHAYDRCNAYAYSLVQTVDTAQCNNSLTSKTFPVLLGSSNCHVS